jgi:hypothetical protein
VPRIRRRMTQGCHCWHINDGRVLGFARKRCRGTQTAKQRASVIVFIVASNLPSARGSRGVTRY